MIDNDDQPFSSRSSAWMTRGVSKAFEFSGRNDSYWSRQNRGALSFTSFTLFVCVRAFDYGGDDDCDGNHDFYESNGDCDRPYNKLDSVPVASTSLIASLHGQVVRVRSLPEDQYCHQRQEDYHTYQCDQHYATHHHHQQYQVISQPVKQRLALAHRDHPSVGVQHENFAHLSRM